MDLVARLTLKDDMSARMKKVTQSLSDVEKRTRSATSGFKNLTTSMAGMAGAIGLTSLLSSGMGLLKSSIGKAFDRIDVMERFQSTMTLLLGSTDAAKKSLDAINEIVTGTAFGLDLAAKSVQAFVSRGIELNKATGWFETLGDAVTFYGDGSNEQLESVMTAMGKMVSSGKISMMQMNTLFAAGIDAPGIYAKATGKSVTDVRKSLSKGKVPVEDFFDTVVTAMKEGTNGVQKIAGAAKESGATWENVIANMKTAIVRGVMTIIMTIDEMLEKNGLPKMREMISAFGKASEKAIKRVAQVIGPVISAFVKMYNAIKPAIPIIKSLASAIGIALVAVGGFFAIIGIIKMVAAAFMAVTWPVWLVIGAIAGLVLGFQAAYKHSEPFRKAIDGIVGAVKGLFALLSGNDAGAYNIMRAAGLDSDQIAKVQAFSKSIKGAISKVGSVFKGAVKIISGDSRGGSDILRAAGLDMAQVKGIQAFSKGVKTAIGKVKSVFDGIGTMLSGGGAGDLLSALGFSPDMIAKITEFVTGIKTTIGTFVAHLKAKWAEIQPSIEMLIGHFVGLKDTAISVFTTLMGVLQPIFSALGTAFGIIADIAVIAFNNIIAPAVRFVITMFKALWTVVGPVLELLGAAIETTFTILKVIWDTVLKPLAEWLTGTFVTVFEAMQGQLATATENFGWLGDKISGVVDWFKGVTDAVKNFKVPNWLSKLGGGGTVKFEETTTEAGGSGGKSKYHGIDYVPYDGYQISAHKGERLQTAQEVRESKQGGGFGGGVSISGNTFHVRQESDIDAVAESLLQKLLAAEGGGGY